MFVTYLYPFTSIITAVYHHFKTLRDDNFLLRKSSLYFRTHPLLWWNLFYPMREVILSSQLSRFWSNIMTSCFHLGPILLFLLSFSSFMLKSRSLSPCYDYFGLNYRCESANNALFFCTLRSCFVDMLFIPETISPQSNYCILSGTIMPINSSSICFKYHYALVLWFQFYCPSDIFQPS